MTEVPNLDEKAPAERAGPGIEGPLNLPEGPTLNELQRFVDPLTGIVARVERAPTGTSDVTTFTAFFGFGGEANDLHALRNSAVSQGAGVGTNDHDAQVAAICEALERHSGVAAGDEPTVSARYEDLDPESVVDPTACMLYSDMQYAMRATINARGAAFDLVPEPFDPRVEMEWSAAWSLTHSRFRLLPATLLFYFYRQPQSGPYCWADSNGCAAGRSLLDATRRGLLELVERDAVAIWWYNRLRRPAIDLTAVEDEDVQRLLGTYTGLNRELWALDLTGDLGIPVCAVVSRLCGGRTEDIVLGFGADTDPVRALRHAMLEATHILPAVLPQNRLEDGEYPYPDPAQKRWWRTATVESEQYLRPAGGKAIRWLPDTSQCSGLTPQESSLSDVLHRVERAGIEVLMLDQTRPDVGLPVVKVLAPGLRHFWARLAPGRLFDVPVTQGWLPSAKGEDELNPISMFL